MSAQRCTIGSNDRFAAMDLILRNRVVVAWKGGNNDPGEYRARMRGPGLQLFPD
jgi:hypothetical protein